MNCEEMNIWLDQATPNELLNPGVSRTNHISNCDSCSASYNSLLQAFNAIDKQKALKLPVSNSEHIVRLLKTNNKNSNTVNPFFKLSKIAAAAVIIIGMATGLLAGIFLSKASSQQSKDTWSTEFSMLSDNEDYLTSIFD